MTELVFTAYDVNLYLREALPALKAAIYRADLSKAKDVLAVYDDTLYDEWALSEALVDGDHSWVFTETAAEPGDLDPDGTLIGLIYPLILTYHHPEVVRIVLGGSELNNLDKVLPFVRVVPYSGPQTPEPVSADNEHVQILPGFREGLRTMWEIVGYISPEGTAALRDHCLAYIAGQNKVPAITRLLKRLAETLKPAVDLGYGLVIERD